MTSTRRPAGGKQASAHAYLLPPPPPFGLDATTVSSSPSFSILPDTHSLPPAHWLRQPDRTVSQSRCCVQRPARGTGRIGPMRARGADAPQPGRGAEAEWAVLPQSACGRGRAGTSSRRGVDGGGDDDVPQSLGWARRRRPGIAEGSAVSGGGPRGPRRHGRAVDGLARARRGEAAVVQAAATFGRARGWGGPGRGSSRTARGRGAGLAGRRGAGGLGRREEPPPAAGPRRRAARRRRSRGGPA